MSGRDVAIACMLGAEEFGFATAPLVTHGLRDDAGVQSGHLPGGHRHPEPGAAQALPGQAGICDELHAVSWPRSCGRSWRGWASARVEELVGRGDLLRVRQHQQLPAGPRPSTMSRIVRSRCIRRITDARRTPIDFHTGKDGGRAGAACKKLEPEKCEAAERRAGCIQHGPGLRHHLRQRSDPRPRHVAARRIPIPIRCNGRRRPVLRRVYSEGRDHPSWSGDSNDYFGKGLSGGKLVVYPPEDSPLPRRRRTSSSATWRCTAPPAARPISAAWPASASAVRNSGAIAVVEGVGDHGCEYMTGGCVVILGSDRQELRCRHVRRHRLRAGRAPRSVSARSTRSWSTIEQP